jgi:hypothetical protein
MDQKYILLNGEPVDVSGAKKFVDENDLSQIQIKLQDGTIKEKGVNGLQIDDAILLLAEIVKSFNERFPCRENSMVITKLEEAQLWCEKRKMNRIQRGVEGYNKA